MDATSSPAPVLATLHGDARPKECLHVTVSGARTIGHAWETATDPAGPWTPIPGVTGAELPLVPALRGRHVRAAVSTDDGTTVRTEPRLVDPSPGNPAADWLHEARYGICHHVLSDFVNRVAADETERWREDETWDDFLDTFDVAEYVAQVQETGAAFVLLTLGQNSGYFLAPNKAYEELCGLVPGQRTPSRRDLAAEVGAALAEIGVALMLYIPANPPNNAHLEPGDFAITDRFGHTRQLDGPPSQQTMAMWQAVIREYGERYPNAAGWWFDGVFPDLLAAYDDLSLTYNWNTLTAAAKAGNPSRVVTYNRGVDLFPDDNPWLDYTSGELNDIGPLPDGRWVDQDESIQWFALTYLGETDPTFWGWGNHGTSKETEDLVAWASQAVERGGVICLDTKVNRFGRFDGEQLAQLRAVSEAVRATQRRP